MTILTEAKLFERSSVPLTVRDQMNWGPSGPVTADAVKVVFGISGWARVDAPTTQVALNSGTVLVIPPGIECAGLPAGPVRTVTFYLQRDYLAAELRWLPRTHPMVHLLHQGVHDATAPEQLFLPEGAMKYLSPYLARIAQLEARRGEEFAMLSVAAQIADMVGRFAGAKRPPPEGARHELMMPRREVVASITLLRRQPDHVWTVEELARRVVLSSSQLTRLFRRETGLSPSAYLRYVRVDRMAELLATGGLTIAEAARSAGWSSPTVASRAFKRRYGLSPRDYSATTGTSHGPERG